MALVNTLTLVVISRSFDLQHRPALPGSPQAAFCAIVKLVKARRWCVKLRLAFSRGLNAFQPRRGGGSRRVVFSELPFPARIVASIRGLERSFSLLQLLAQETR